MSDTDYCDFGIAEYTIGRLYTPQLLEEVRAKANGATVRVTGPRFASDRKRVPGRISLLTNADRIIISIQCG
ncbi:hypothetical protein ACQR3P_11160 [Rhodococcus sp. IEGM1300]